MRAYIHSVFLMIGALFIMAGESRLANTAPASAPPASSSTVSGMPKCCDTSWSDSASSAAASSDPDAALANYDGPRPDFGLEDLMDLPVLAARLSV